MARIEALGKRVLAHRRRFPKTTVRLEDLGVQSPQRTAQRGMHFGRGVREPPRDPSPRRAAAHPLPAMSGGGLGEPSAQSVPSRSGPAARETRQRREFRGDFPLRFTRRRRPPMRRRPRCGGLRRCAPIEPALAPAARSMCRPRSSPAVRVNRVVGADAALPPPRPRPPTSGLVDATGRRVVRRNRNSRRRSVASASSKASLSSPRRSRSASRSRPPVLARDQGEKPRRACRQSLVARVHHRVEIERERQSIERVEQLHAAVIVVHAHAAQLFEPSHRLVDEVRAAAGHAVQPRRELRRRRARMPPRGQLGHVVGQERPQGESARALGIHQCPAGRGRGRRSRPRRERRGVDTCRSERGDPHRAGAARDRRPR